MKIVNKIIKRLEALKKKQNEYNETIITDRLLTKDEIKMLIHKCMSIFKKEQVLIQVKAPIKIFGDIHG